MVKGDKGSTLFVVLSPDEKNEIVVVPAGVANNAPDTSQSPAVSTIAAMLLGVVVVTDMAPLVVVNTSPIDPALALSARVVPTIPAVVDGVMVLVATIVVPLTASAVVWPIATLSMVPAVAGLIVTVPVPVGLATTLALAGLKDTAPVAVRVVDLTARGVVTPIEVLFIVEAVAGLMVTVPVPVGLIVTVALAGLNVVVLDDDRVVNAPVLATVFPIEGGEAK